MNNESGYSSSFQDKANDWAQLAQQDPEAFETMRSELLNEFIQSSPSRIQKQLEGVQWKIDHIRQRANSPEEALAEITTMMWEAAQQLGQRQQELLALCSGEEPTSTPSRQTAQILDFKLRQH